MIVRCIMKTDLFSLSPLLLSGKANQPESWSSRQCPDWTNSCFNVGFEHSLMSDDSFANKSNSIPTKDSWTTALKHTDINQQPDHWLEEMNTKVEQSGGGYLSRHTAPRLKSRWVVFQPSGVTELSPAANRLCLAERTLITAASTSDGKRRIINWPRRPSVRW